MNAQQGESKPSRTTRGSLCPSISLTAAVWIESVARPILFALHFEQNLLSIPVLPLCIARANGYSALLPIPPSSWISVYFPIGASRWGWPTAAELSLSPRPPLTPAGLLFRLKEVHVFWLAYSWPGGAPRAVMQSMLIRAYGDLLRQARSSEGRAHFCFRLFVCTSQGEPEENDTVSWAWK